MEHPKILNLLNKANNSRQENGTLSMMNHLENMVKETKLSIIQKF